MLQAQKTVLSIGAATIQQYEPLLVCLSITNNTGAAKTLRYSSRLNLERETAANVWQQCTPWVGANPWTYDIDIYEEYARVDVKGLAAGKTYWRVWRPLLTPAALVPGNYRIKPIEIKVGEVVVGSTAVVPFSVVAHAGNAAAATADMQNYERLMSRKLTGGVDGGLVAVAQAWHANEALSPGLRGWIATELAEYRFETRDYLGSVAIANQVPHSIFPLPCGGLGQCARFHAIRGNRILSLSKAHWDLMTIPLTKMLAQYPEFLSAHWYATFDERRRYLQ